MFRIVSGATNFRGFVVPFVKTKAFQPSKNCITERITKSPCKINILNTPNKKKRLGNIEINIFRL